MDLILQLRAAIELLFLEPVDLAIKVFSLLLERLVLDLLGRLEVPGMLQSLLVLFRPIHLNFTLQLLNQLIKIAAGVLPLSLFPLFIIMLVLQLILQFFVCMRELSDVPIGRF